MLGKQSLPKADVVTAGLLIALGAAVVCSALRMPMGGQYGGVSNPWYASPGMLPLLVGLTLILLSGLLVIRAVRQGALRGFGPFVAGAAARSAKSPATYRALLICVLLMLYATALYFRPAGGLADVLAGAAWMDNRVTGFLLYPEGANYVAASSTFLAAFIGLFYRPGGRHARWKHLPLVIAMSLLVSLLVGYSFSQLLNVPLP